MANTQFVTIGDREYGRCIYSDGTRHYAVLTERRNRYGLRIQRTLNTPAIIAKIDAAIIEADHAEALEIDAEHNKAAWAEYLNSPEVAQERFKDYSAKFKAHFIDCAHAEAVAIDAEQYADHYTYVKPHATSIIMKTDGHRVWWWSSNRGVWFPDVDAYPEALPNIVATGNGEYCANPAP